MKSRRTYRNGPRHRKLKRESMRLFYEKLRVAGWTQNQCWLWPAAVAAIHQRSRALGIFERVIVMAALEAGMKIVTTSDIIRAQKRWSELVGPPARPLWPGAPCDPTKAFSMKRWNSVLRRKKKQEKEKAA